MLRTSQLGAWEFWRKMFPLLKSGHFFAASLGEYTPHPDCVCPDYELLFPWTPGDRIPKGLSGVELSSEVLATRVAAGDLVGFVFHGEQVVHRSLVQMSGTIATETSRRAYSLKEKEAYVHFCATAVSHRGRGLYTVMLQAILVFLKQAGHRTVYISCARQNAASIRGILKAGFRYMSSDEAICLLWQRVNLRFRYDHRHNFPHVSRF